MKLHGNARSCPRSRQLLVDRVINDGWTVANAAAAAGLSDRSAAKWLARYRAEGSLGLLDRSSAPSVIPHRTPDDRIAAIAALRRIRMTAAEISEVLRMPLSTTSAVLTRIGLGRLSRLEPLEPANRYQRQRPGELVHLDIKKLGRIDGIGHRITGDRRRRVRQRNGRRSGWEYVHVCVDDATRLAYAEVLPDETSRTAIGFLRRARRFYHRHGVHIEAVMTDNGSAYTAALYRLACHAHGIRHLRTRPYRPQTNGKAERFIRTILGGWAYGAIYTTSNDRTRALQGWLHFYNHTRPHGSLSHQPPIKRLTALNNLRGHYS